MVVYRRHCNCRQLLSSLPMIRHRHCLCFIVVVICILHSMSLLFCSRDRISCFIVVLPQHRCNTFNKKLSAVCTILHDYLFTVAVSGVMTAVFFRGLNCLALSCSEFWRRIPTVIQIYKRMLWIDIMTQKTCCRQKAVWCNILWQQTCSTTFLGCHLVVNFPKVIAGRRGLLQVEH